MMSRLREVQFRRAKLIWLRSMAKEDWSLDTLSLVLSRVKTRVE